MKNLLIVLGLLSVALWGGEPEIRIPTLGPYYKVYEEGIRKRDPIALMELNLETRGTYVALDRASQEAIVNQVEALAHSGNAYAMYLRANWGGAYGVSDYWFQRAADAGDPYALRQRSNYKKEPERTTYLRKAYETFKGRAEKGDRKAMYELWVGGFGKLVSKQEKDGLEAKLLQAKDRIGYKTMYYKAAVHLNPNVIKEKEEILKMILESANSGEIESMRFLMFYYYEGFCPQEGFDPKKPRNRDLAKAWEWARREWEAMGCQGAMPTPIDYYSEPWLKPGEKKKPKPKPALKNAERMLPKRP